MTSPRHTGTLAAVADNESEERLISDSERVARALAAAPELADWPQPQLARLVPFVWERQLRAGEVLCRRGDRAEHAFCLMDGTVRYAGGTGITASLGFVGQEAALDAPAYLSDILAVTDARVLVVPRTVLRDFGIALGGETLYHSLLAHCTTALHGAPPGAADPAHLEAEEPEVRISRRKSIGWLLTLIVPGLIIAFAERSGLNWHQRDFLAALSVCLLMMSFDLTPQYTAALIAGLACLLLDVAPANVILSGFASDGFFMGLSIFGLGAVLTYSGLVDRMVLNILRLSPRSPFWYNLTILLTGVFMTPCLPSANTRVALMTPLIMDTSRALGYRDRGPEATRLMLSMFVGASLFAPIFLTAKSLNFVVYSQMPQQIREEFQWLKWTMSASLALFVMLALYLAATAVLFRGGAKPRLSKEHLRTQLRLLGPMNSGEWTALIIATTFIIAIVTYSVHKISPAWITLGVLCVFLVLGTLDEQHIRHNFQWDVLLLVGFFIGLEQTLDYTGMTQILTSHLSGVSAYMTSNFVMFLALLALLTAVLRLFLPITTAGVLIASVFVPLAASNGVNPWVVGFAIVTLSEIWFWPPQCSYFLTFEELSGDNPVHDRALFLRMNALTMAIRVVALLVSLPFFKYLGLL